MRSLLNHHTDAQVNAVGPLVLFQAFYALFKAAPGTPKFVVISTFVGSIATGAAAPLGLSAYGPSKAAVNFITRKIHFENEHLSELDCCVIRWCEKTTDGVMVVSFSINPGAVDTDACELSPQNSTVSSLC